MNASSESGLCATVMVSEELTRGFYCSRSCRRGRIDLTCVPPKVTMKSRRDCKEKSCTGTREASKIKSPAGGSPTGDVDERMTQESIGSDRPKAIRPLTGAEKLAPRPQAVN